MLARNDVGLAGATMRFVSSTVGCCGRRRPRKTVRRLCRVLTQWRTMTDFELLTSADIPLIQGLAQRVTATRPDLASAGAMYGELAWNWGRRPPKSSP